MSQEYAMGWRRAALWADRDDLIADIDSPAYKRDMAADLATLRQAARVDENVIDKALEECDVPVAYRHAIIDKLRAALSAQPAERQGAVYAAHPSGDGCIIRKGEGVRLSADEIIAVMNSAAPVGVPDGMVPVPREALGYVADLLAERKYGHAGRSPAHNARIVVEHWLAAAPSAPQEVE